MSTNPYQAPQGNEDAAVPAGLEFAGCPSCGNVYASKVGFTWWGGVLGPKLLSHVKCNQFGTKYNGKSGKSDTTMIIVYSAVLFVISFMFLIFVAIILVLDSG